MMPLQVLIILTIMKIMREIKFKYYFKIRTRDGEEINPIIFSLSEIQRRKFTGLEEDLIAIEQFTGLTDKNGTEIYEGDIIRNFQADVNIVHWYVDSWCYENFHAGALPLGDTCNPYKNQMNGIAENQSEHEVIGNIHEHGHLLK